MSGHYDIGTSALQPVSTLLEASAGTGKTFTIEGIYLRLILEKDLAPRDILTVTYTKAATAELKERIRSRLKSALTYIDSKKFDEDAVLHSLETQSDESHLLARRRINKALLSFDEASIFTIHGFCQRILKEHAFSSARSFDTEFSKQGNAVFVQELARDIWRQSFYLKNPLLAQWLGGDKDGVDGLTAFLNQALGVLDYKLYPQRTPRDWDTFLSDSEKTLASYLQAIVRQRQSNQEEVRRLLYPGDNTFKNKGLDEIHEAWEIVIGLDADSNDLSLYFLSGNNLKRLMSLRTERINNQINRRSHKNLEISHPFFDAFEALSSYLDELILDLQHSLLSKARELLEEKKRKQNQMSFDDLLLFLDESLRTQPDLGQALKQRYRAVLIDEFQDTDPLQWNIFRNLFADGDHDFYLIGDPKQAIYGFRGADIFTYFSATAACPRQFTLSRNYRSAKALVDAVNVLFSQREQVFRFEDISYNAVDTPENTDDKTLYSDSDAIHPAPMQLVAVGWDAEQAKNKEVYAAAIRRFVGEEIRRLLKSGETRIGEQPVRPGDIAILVRNGYQGRDMVDSLRDEGIPVVMQSNDSVFDTAEAKEIEQLMRCLLEPQNSGYLRTFLLSSLGGRSLADLSQWDADEDAWSDEVERVQRSHRLWKDQGFMRMFQDLLYAQGALARIIQGERGERKSTNYLHLSELINQAEDKQDLTPEELRMWLSQQIKDKNKRENDVDELRMENDEQAVQVITAHKSKGLQYPIVFCPYHWRPQTLSGKNYLKYQDPETQERCLCLETYSSLDGKTQSLIKEEELSNEIRLLYVALTRAIARCYLFIPNAKGVEESPLAEVITPEGTMLTKEVLVQLAESHSDTMHLRFVEDEDEEEVPAYRAAPLESQAWHSHRKLSRSLSAPLSFTSFSGLTRNLSEEVDFAKDEGYVEMAMTEADEVALLFPKGVRTGNYFHQLLENIEFHDSQSWPKEVKKLQSRYGFDEAAQYEKSIKGLQQLMNRRLETVEGEAFRLKDLDPTRKVVEREFYFKMEHFDEAALQKLQELLGYRRQLSLANTLRGFMKGFIDLLFEYEGRYYILDWKTNYLGPDIKSYGPEKVREAMHQHHYDLQYLIYTVALDMALEQRIPAYDYGRDFGGVYYLFIRGIMDSENESPYGVYYDRPKADMIRTLRHLLTEGGSHE